MTVYCDLSKDPDIFKGKGDYQFQVYRLMRKENRYSKSCSVSNAWRMMLTCQEKPLLLKHLEIVHFLLAQINVRQECLATNLKPFCLVNALFFWFSTTMKPLLHIPYLVRIFGPGTCSSNVIFFLLGGGAL